MSKEHVFSLRFSIGKLKRGAITTSFDSAMVKKSRKLLWRKPDLVMNNASFWVQALLRYIPAKIYMFKVNNRNTRKRWNTFKVKNKDNRAMSMVTSTSLYLPLWTCEPSYFLPVRKNMVKGNQGGFADVVWNKLVKHKPETFLDTLYCVYLWSKLRSKWGSISLGKQLNIL